MAAPIMFQMISDFNLSQTPTFANFPADVVNSTGTPSQYIYNKLYPLAFADAVHDQVVKQQQYDSVCNKKLQCDYFNEAMPNPKTPCLLGPDKGLAIDSEFKKKDGCEEKVWHSIISGVCKLGPVTTPTIPGETLTVSTPSIIDGSNSNFKPGIGLGHSNYLYNFDMNNDIPNIGYAIKTYNNKVYKVVKLKWGGSSGTSENALGVTGFNLGKALGVFDNPTSPTGALPKYEAFVIHDADNVGLPTQFKKGVDRPDAILYYLMLPEYMCDSATKKPWKTNKELCIETTGVKILFAGKMRSNYPEWTNNNRNTFFSRFSCQMTVTDWIDKKVDQRWGENSTSSDPLGNEVETITNPSKQNNRTNIETYLKSATDNVKKQLALQRKRSGDQLQALAVKRLTDNIGTVQFHISTDQGDNPPSNTCGFKTFNNTRRHTWLITHDLTLCSYALFLGINVLHTHYDKSKKIKSVTSFRLLSNNATENFN
jgi:hypothetical protein